MASQKCPQRRDVRLFRASVVSSTRLTPSMQRVTVAGADLLDFPWCGYDHWFRLFFRHPHQERFHAPEVEAETWWKPYLAMPEETRPYCANYTVADFRAEAGELDIDVVVHRRPDGEIEGGAAAWACSAEPGEELATRTAAPWPARPACGSTGYSARTRTPFPGTRRWPCSAPTPRSTRPATPSSSVSRPWPPRAAATWPAPARPKARITFSGFWKSERRPDVHDGDGDS